jgi:hypothetical protein
MMVIIVVMINPFIFIFISKIPSLIISNNVKNLKMGKKYTIARLLEKNVLGIYDTEIWAGINYADGICYILRCSPPSTHTPRC